jgi:hypothetical protein
VNTCQIPEDAARVDLFLGVGVYGVEQYGFAGQGNAIELEDMAGPTIAESGPASSGAFGGGGDFREVVGPELVGGVGGPGADGFLHGQYGEAQNQRGQDGHTHETPQPDSTGERGGDFVGLRAVAEHHQCGDQHGQGGYLVDHFRQRRGIVFEHYFPGDVVLENVLAQVGQQIDENV